MISSTLYSSATDEWATPQDFFDKLNDEFHFTLDPCASTENHKCKKYYTKEQNGLLQDWGKEIVFCNPPYGKEIKYWCRKAYESSLGGGNSSVSGSFPNRHEVVSRLGIWKGGVTFCERQVEIRWIKKLCSIPIINCNL